MPSKISTVRCWARKYFEDVPSEIVIFGRLALAVLRRFRETFQDDARDAFFETMLSHVSFFEDVPNEIVILGSLQGASGAILGSILGYCSSS